MNLGEMIRPARKAKGLTLREAAREIGCHFTYLSKLEHDASAAPSDRLIYAMASLYEIDADRLFIAAGKAPTYLVELLSQNFEAVDMLRSWRMCIPEGGSK